MRKTYIIAIIIIIIVLAILTGYYIYKITTKNEDANDINQVANYVVENQEISNATDNSINVNSEEEKITINTSFVLRKYYNSCSHTINEYVELPEEIINMTRNELALEYSSWEIVEFSKEEVILMKEVSGICGEHYLLKEEDGFIAVYELDEDENQTLMEITDISIEYIPSTDLLNLEQGIKIYGKEALNSTLEDYE